MVEMLKEQRRLWIFEFFQGFKNDQGSQGVDVSCYFFFLGCDFFFSKSENIGCGNYIFCCFIWCIFDGERNNYFRIIVLIWFCLGQSGYMVILILVQFYEFTNFQGRLIFIEYDLYVDFLFNMQMIYRDIFKLFVLVLFFSWVFIFFKVQIILYF